MFWLTSGTLISPCLWLEFCIIPMLSEQKPISILFPVSFYVSIAISTLTMFVYIVLIYRNYKKDLRKMYSGDFSFLPIKVREQENKAFVVSIK